MIKIVLLNQATLIFDEFDESVVTLFHMQPLDFRHGIREQAVGIHRAGQVLALFNDLASKADTVIVLTKGQGLVHNARTGIIRHVFIRQCEPSP